MNISNKQLRAFFIYLLSVLALLIYIYGFFSIKYSPNIQSHRSTNGSRARFINKLAFIVIDALRYDFVMPSNQQIYMPFTLSSILNNKSCFLATKAHSPTVTMPRLKAITSGTLSTYIDVVLNFMSSNFEEDNFIKIAVENQLKIIFYGDETWLKLFPKSFTRSEGTNSFFTLDYTEVDNNVTRHIDRELNNTDWDIIILHYLGLDHIGHTVGPNSPLVTPKLKEMDDIIKKISNYFKLLEERENIKTVVLVTSDHGMKDSGSHGGVTYPEVTIPLVSVGNPCVSLPGWPEKHMSNQIDIAPTISVLLGLPIPGNSMGKIIPALLHNMQTPEILKYLEANRAELNKFKKLSDNDLQVEDLRISLKNWLSSSKKSVEVAEVMVEKYFQNLNKISQELVNSNSDFKMLYLALAVVFLWIFLSILLYHVSQVPKPQGAIHWFLIFGTVSHALSLISSSFIEEEHQTWYFFWATFSLLTCLKILSLKCSNYLKMSLFFPWIVVIISHRFLRKLNQTGDKWAFLPDIKSFLNSGEGKIWLFPFYIIGIGMVFGCALNKKCPLRQLVTYGISLLAVVCHRIATGNFHAEYLEFYPTSRGILEVSVFWTFMAVFILQTAQNKTPIHLVWLLLVSLLLRPHNIILLPAQVFMSRQIHNVFDQPENSVWNNMAHIWLGNLFYFYQGNGNSLANVDVASGFVGIQTYNPVYAGIMMVAHTTNAHILSFILSPKSNLIYATARLIPLAVYCTALLFQLHHLFIWSVFSPKLLYEINTTLIFLLLTLVNSLRLVTLVNRNKVTLVS